MCFQYHFIFKLKLCFQNANYVSNLIFPILIFPISLCFQSYSYVFIMYFVSYIHHWSPNSIHVSKWRCFQLRWLYKTAGDLVNRYVLLLEQLTGVLGTWVWLYIAILIRVQSLKTKSFPDFQILFPLHFEPIESDCLSAMAGFRLNS